jgi:hypothetical protein
VSRKNYPPSENVNDRPGSINAIKLGLVSAECGRSTV